MAKELTIETQTGTIKTLSYSVDDIEEGSRKFEELMADRNFNFGRDWKVLEPFKIVDGQFVCTIVSTSPYLKPRIEKKKL